MSILTQPIGKGKSKKNTNVQLKTYINFAEKNQKKEAGWRFAVPGVILVAVVVVLLAKFAIIDRLNEVDVMQNDVKRLQEQLENDMAVVRAANDINYEFYHYTWTGMTDEEKKRPHRTFIMDLIEEIGSGDVIVKRYSVSDDVVEMSVVADTLDTINKMKIEVVKKDSIDSAIVSTAQKQQSEGGGFETEVQTNENGEAIVEAQLRIYLISLDAGSN